MSRRHLSVRDRRSPSCRRPARRGATGVASAAAAATTAASVVAAATAVALGPGVAVAAGGSQWRTVPGPAVPAADSANLTALVMTGPVAGWAAGFTVPNAPAAGGFEPLLASWNGRKWTLVRVSVGSPGGRLDGVAAVSARDVWAVGTAYPNGNSAQPLILHFNGRRWTRTRAATGRGVQDVSLMSVAARSASDAWAVGQQETSTGVVSPVIEHWNGRVWRLARVPDISPFRQAGLESVAVAADGQAWAVGSPFDNARRPLVLHWTGQAWRLAATPAASGDVLASGVTAVSPRAVWVVGTVSAGSAGAFHAYAASWNGTRWATARVPAVGPAAGSAGFLSVAATGGRRVMAVGSELNSVTGGALYGVWNGSAWSVRLGRLTRADAQLDAVAFDGTAGLWAVGSTDPSPQTFRPLVQVDR